MSRAASGDCRLLATATVASACSLLRRLPFTGNFLGLLFQTRVERQRQKRASMAGRIFFAHAYAALLTFISIRAQCQRKCSQCGGSGMEWMQANL